MHFIDYVMADAKTNWAEGWVLLSFYIMIVSYSRYFYVYVYVLKKEPI